MVKGVGGLGRERGTPFSVWETQRTWQPRGLFDSEHQLEERKRVERVDHHTQRPARDDHGKVGLARQPAGICLSYLARLVAPRRKRCGSYLTPATSQVRSPGPAAPRIPPP